MAHLLTEETYADLHFSGFYCQLLCTAAGFFFVCDHDCWSSFTSHSIFFWFFFFLPQGPNPDAGNQLAPFSCCFSTFTVLKYNQAPGLLCGRSWGWRNTISACQQCRPIKKNKISVSPWNDEMRWCEPFFVQWTFLTNIVWWAFTIRVDIIRHTLHVFVHVFQSS